MKYLEERFPDWPGLSILVRGKEKEYGAQLKELGYEYDLCLESLGGKYLTGALDSLAPMGRLLHFGATHSYGGAADGLRKWLTFAAGWLSRPLIDPGALVPKNIAVIGFNLIWLTERDELMAQELEDIAAERDTWMESALCPLPTTLPWCEATASGGDELVRVRVRVRVS